MYAKRLDNLPSYLFAQIDVIKAQKRAEGVDLVDLGVGDPDLATPAHIVDALCEAVRDPVTHHYPDYLGMIEYRKAVAGLQSLGFTVHVPKATFYAWMKVHNSVEFTQKMINEAGIVVTPGTGFGPNDEGYVRFAITHPVERINEAIERMKEHNITGTTP